MPPVEEPQDVQSAPSANQSKPFIFIGVGVFVLLAVGISFVMWKNNQSTLGTQAQITSTESTSTAPTWIICADESCQSTTTVTEDTLSPIFEPGTDTDSGYFKGANTVYYWDDHNAVGHYTLINLHADPNTFVTFPVVNETYGKDKNTVWFGDQIVQGADASTFTANDLYGQDASHAYYMGDIIIGADPKTFTPIGVNYSKDADHVYFGTSTVPGADPQTIQVIDDYSLAKDKNHVYQYGKILPGVNPATYVPPPAG